ncbi:inner centromere protein A isoform X2 [Anthonomus grandis grandis]|uniref:inner centromere protein A isoform X2 n=1 Tax=Anthonomus grandis grandis TaxID=2921223 RepID=UPI0021668161|nr:inner centromere protein A isoform X2 [Anthonomus grandis grandis]
MTLKEKTENLFNELTAESNNFKNGLFEKLNPLMVAIERYAKKGEIDVKTLKITNEQMDILNGKKSGRRRKKLFPVDENAATFLGSKIKKEKVSLLSTQPLNETATLNQEAVKENTNVNGMPAPSWIPPKKKVKEIKTERTSVRLTRTKGKKAERDSDVILENPKITTVTLTDTDESEESSSQKETRSTRTKTKLQQSKDTEESDTESKRGTRTKTIKKKNDAAEEVIEEKRSTRTKTIKKATTAEEQVPNIENEPEKRSTRTKTIKKGASQEEALPEVETTRSTRTKTIKTAQPPDVAAPEPARSTRTKTKIQMEKEAEKLQEPVKPKPKRGRSDSSSGDDEIKERKKTKSKSPVREDTNNSSAHTVYEDAQCNLAPVPDSVNSTFVKVPSKANSTVVIDQPNFNIFQKQAGEALLTDDDSIETKTPPKKEPTQSAKKGPGKEVFSPYEKTTLKKKVEAFEKLQNNSEIPISKKMSQGLKGTPASVKQKARLFTPSGIKFLPSSCSTSKLPYKTTKHTGASTSLLGTPNETLNIQGSVCNDRERQRKIMEREQALKKKEALLQAQSEAKRKLNQEKQIKAQQQRKLFEAEKQKQMEVEQKQKEEKQKQREREREEYLQKHKLEQEKKRMAQKMRLQAQLQENATKPIYMVTPLPDLPTADCYDSDDPNYKTSSVPNWSTDSQWCRTQQFTMLAAGERIKNTLFCVHAQTPDLVELFETIDQRKLKRSSSQMWKKPPRYTMMPDLNETKFSEDEYDSD